MPSAAFVLPRLFPLHPFAAALAYHCHRRGGDNKVVMRKSWRCRRWHCQRCDTSQGNQRCDHCAHVALQCASSECRFKREQRCHIPLFGLLNAILWALCAIAARVSRALCAALATITMRRTGSWLMTPPAASLQGSGRPSRKSSVPGSSPDFLAPVRHLARPHTGACPRRPVAEQRKRIAAKIKELQPKASNKQIARTLGVAAATIDRDIASNEARTGTPRRA